VKGIIELDIRPSGCIELHVVMEQNRSAPEIDRYAQDRLAATPTDLVSSWQKLCGGEQFQAEIRIPLNIDQRENRLSLFRLF
jgi:hypothetical protein